MHVKKQQLKPYMEQLTGSVVGKEYVKAVYCHSVYLTYITVDHVKCWLDELKLAARFPGEISVTSDIQMIPL